MAIRAGPCSIGGVGDRNSAAEASSKRRQRRASFVAFALAARGSLTLLLGILFLRRFLFRLLLVVLPLLHDPKVEIDMVLGVGAVRVLDVDRLVGLPIAELEAVRDHAAARLQSLLQDRG